MSEQSCDGLSPDQINRITEAMQDDEELALRILDEQYAAHPYDARLPMVRGPLLAGRGEYGVAGIDLRDALALAPAMHVARFMLGYLELVTSAPARAVTVWAPLLDLDSDPALQAFTQGMVLTVQDRLTEAQAAFRTGLAAGDTHPELVRLVRALEQALGIALGQQGQAEPVGSEEDAGRHWLLGGYLARH